MDAAALALAFILDIVIGEPPAAIHPVVYLGKTISWLDRRAPKVSRIAQFSYGLGVAIVLPATAATAGYFLVTVTRDFNSVLYIIVAGFLLKTCFSIRGLGRAARSISRDLEADKPEQARTDLSALVSRDTANMKPYMIASAAIESVAENTSDSFVAPWIAFAIFGLPGALAYRTVNTLDAMIGYKGRYEYLGKASARLDDVLNFIPARISAIFIVLAGRLRIHSIRRALSVMSKEGNTTESPNAGFPMAAMAGTLGVTLEKEGHYRLGSGLRQPVAADIEESVRIMQWVSVLACCLALTLLAVRHAI